MNMKDKEEEESEITGQFLAWALGIGEGTTQPGELWREEHMWVEK